MFIEEVATMLGISAVSSRVLLTILCVSDTFPLALFYLTPMVLAWPSNAHSSRAGSEATTSMKLSPVYWTHASPCPHSARFFMGAVGQQRKRGGFWE
jgi:hypothetical protein